MKTGIRSKTILTIFPVVLASLAFIGTSALFGARGGMIRLALENLSFKAEMLQQYVDSQWRLLETQGYAEDPEFRRAVALSIETYARSLLRATDERIYALDLDGVSAFSVSWELTDPGIPDELLDRMRLGLTGPVMFKEGTGERYGQAFYFEPLQWYLVVSNRSQAIFAETDKLSVTILSGFIVALLVSLGLLIILTGRITKPIVTVTRGMTDIIESNSFDISLPVLSDDEVGTLTLHFNALCRELDRSYSRIRSIALREMEARYETAERELQAIIALGKVAEFRDEDTASHTIRVGLYSRILADMFFTDEEDKRSIFYAAPLHDIGKIGIPDSILLKPGTLTPEEFQFMKTHTTIGHAILREFENPALAMGATIALSHHERYDGTGYPQGIAGGDIPLCGRILAIVDVFDAMTSERPYKKAWEPDRAFEYIREQRGRHFDPDLAQAFLDRRSEVLHILENNR